MSENGRATLKDVVSLIGRLEDKMDARFDRLDVRVDKLEAARDRGYWPRTIGSWVMKTVVSLGVPAIVALLVARA